MFNLPREEIVCFLCNRDVSNAEIRHSSFLQGSRCVLLRSLMTKQKVEAVAGRVETISVLLRSMKTYCLSVSVRAMWEPSFLSC